MAGKRYIWTVVRTDGWGGINIYHYTSKNLAARAARTLLKNSIRDDWDDQIEGIEAQKLRWDAPDRGSAYIDDPEDSANRVDIHVVRGTVVSPADVRRVERRKAEGAG